MKKPTLQVTSDFTKQFNDIINAYKTDIVLVGIPADHTERKIEEGEEPKINNATIMALNNFGSAANNILAWPVMEIGIKNAQEQIAEQYRLAAKNSLRIGLDALDIYYNRAGIIASNSIKKVINAQEGLPPDRPKESTLEARKRKGFKGKKALIVSGQLRNSITYVVNKGGLK